MKKFALFLIACLSCALFSTSYAQDDYEEMSKKERKELEKQWKNEVKKYAKNPLAFKELIEEYEEEAEALREEAAGYQDEIVACTAEKEKLQVQLDEMMQSPEAEDTTMAMTETPVEGVAPAGSSAGMAYKVQIGAFKKYANEYFEEPMTMVNDPNDGMNKYVIGSFATENEAETFKKELRRLGFSGAWVVPYKNGARMPKDQM